VDLVAGIQPRHIDELMIAGAIERRSSFNLIHLPTSIKVDVFVPPEDAYPRTAMQRRREDTLLEGGETLPVASLDVTGVIKVQAGALDTAYLQHWGGVLGLTALVGRAFADSGVHFP
jgi:hypothetical protein